MIQILPEHKLTVVFTADTDRDDITSFANIIEKCAKEAKKSGFKSLFNGEEGTVIKALHETLEGVKS